MFYLEKFGANRKDQHLGLAHQQYSSQPATDFTETLFVHHSLPQTKVDEVDISTRVVGLDFQFPFFINAMTGGSKKTGDINRLLGIMGHFGKIALASGSISAAIKDPSVAKTFSVMRRENPYGIIFANLGAHHDVDDAKRAVDLLEANAIQIHVNAPQEIIMPEGDRDFSMWLKNIEALVRELKVPVIAKEVGFGMSRETVAQLASVGVETIDISGTGGTNFAKIENVRRTFNDYDYLEDWGQSTVISLVEAMSVSEKERPALIASGGIKTPLDIVKSLALGADLVGMSNRFLQYVKDVRGNRFDEGLQAISSFQRQIAEIMTMLGAKNIADLRKKDLILAPNVQNWCEARGIDWKAYANRSRN
ncbi:type 2 isopentenyl-diphosphate Delta-isomerase [Streptococcus ruminantium]|uniref:Isopentenyl-diphosphate delta-isomerase n=1 Tax=Streptococcus ruminantium TaxID=1917441 RepID=A0ABU1B2F6_9STRE|nr:type 2 isopentenyl-diphosphate Delta-isomerase [Streptococcus ruminantium]MDQ8759644.1 type 2 isopentenyl-diphosphate Delta-isomerase [Streptococcus ruminantium]MDQ8765795.1 type 2 isopentenyl-diphosphate Delta-isomerase [Streptococcus ruminantium]MDQ8767911.1 type 2 isopentenyl-diphosphate Delta-isomerase [Streptococcus ruminantium]MDQ8768800.1 type 2 isopentenyl-diphosphate Delta-isomerase [Streptococcus ruminantium]MDQ8774721.1 type 2 isopentenyl-diphosphate Delta-isomerase [Streptococcu